MANKNPDLYTIRLGVKQIRSAVSKNPVCAKLTVGVTKRPYAGGEETTVGGDAWDGITLVARPGDWVQFELGDIDFKGYGSPSLSIEWKKTGGKGWPTAPTAFGKPMQIPPGEGFGAQRLSWKADLDLGKDLDLPCQIKSDSGTTLVSIDPDIIVDES